MQSNDSNVESGIRSNLKKGCLTAILFVFGSWGLFFGLTFGYVEPPYMWTATFFAGTFFMIGLGCVWSAPRNIVKRNLFSPANLAKAPQAGGKAVVEGTLEAIREPLKAPFSDRKCIAYEYAVYKITHRRSGTGSSSTSSSHKTTYYSGTHLRPSRIRARWGDVRLLAMPNLDNVRNDDGDLETAKQFIAETEFETQKQGFGGISEALGELVDVMSDDDGTVEKDWYHDTDPPHANSLSYSEKILPVGAMVVVTGTYDALKRAMIPDAELSMIIELGSAAENRPGWGWIGFCLLFGLAVVAVTLAPALMPRLPSAMIAGLPFAETAYEYRIERIEQAISRNDDASFERFAQLGLPPGLGQDLIWRTRNPAQLRQLLEAGAQPDHPNGSGHTRLMRVDDIEMARELLDHGADPDLADSQGYTSLMNALINHRLDIARLMLDAGADVSIRLGDQSLVDIATEAGISDPDLLKRLQGR